MILLKIICIIAMWLAMLIIVFFAYAMIHLDDNIAVQNRKDKKRKNSTKKK